MTRLFLRFYLGVIAILIAAWLIQSSVFRQSTVEENLPVVEDIFASSARLARDRITAGGEEKFPETMEYLKSQFDYPIGVVTREERAMEPSLVERLDRGESVLFYDRLETAIPDSPYLIELGPLPRFDEPSQAELSFALGGVFSLAAIGIAILLRPVIVQLRGVEKTALAIAGGDLGARIDHGRFRHSAPLAGAFNAMADRVETLLRSQRELLQTVSHELRTPLARIRFATELMQSTDDVKQQKQRVAAIDDATDQLDGLVGELLTYVRLDAGTETASVEEVDTGELVGELIEIHSPLYPEIEFLVEDAGSFPVMSANRSAIARGLGNLIGNAGKYARSRVVVSGIETGGRVELTVEDDGAGIPVEARESVFEPFNRLLDSNPVNGDQVGTGLGLALVKRIAERNGGEVSVDQSPLGGARFVLSLSLNRNQDST